jgi:hypothetical protein
MRRSIFAVAMVAVALLSACSQTELMRISAKSGDPVDQYRYALAIQSGSVNAAPGEDARWLLASARQGYTPAMLALAAQQYNSGYKQPAVGWIILAARFNDANARSLLQQMGLPIPEPDLFEAQQLADRQAEAAALSSLGFALGCALSGGYCAPVTVDGSGNSYFFSRGGAVTSLRGENPNTGSTWSEQLTRSGNVTYYSGISNGRPWNMTGQRVGSQMYYSGTDAAGHPFSYSCNSSGC